MLVYIVLLVLVIGGRLLLGNKKKQWGNIFYFIICLFILFVVGFRSERMGADAGVYRRLFLHPVSLDINVVIKEPGIYVLNSIIRFFTNDVNAASVIKSVLCLTPLFLLIRKKSIDMYSTLFLFITFSYGQSLFLLEFSMERQCIALAFYCVFLYLYSQNNYVYNTKCFVSLALMILFHYSSLFVLLLLLIDKVRISKKIYLIITIVASGSLFIIGDYANQLYQIATDFDKGFYLSYYDHNKGVTLLGLLPFIGSFLVALFFFPKKEINTLWFKSFFLSVVLTAVLMPIGNNIDRMCAYYYVGAIICLPRVFVYIRNTIMRYSFILILFAYFTSRFVHSLQAMEEIGYIVMPYETFLK